MTDLYKTSDEIAMWRKRYLFFTIINDQQMEYFLSIPSEEFMKKSPEENLENVKNLEKISKISNYNFITMEHKS